MWGGHTSTHPPGPHPLQPSPSAPAFWESRPHCPPVVGKPTGIYSAGSMDTVMGTLSGHRLVRPSGPFLAECTRLVEQNFTLLTVLRTLSLNFSDITLWLPSYPSLRPVPPACPLGPSNVTVRLGSIRGPLAPCLLRPSLLPAPCVDDSRVFLQPTGCAPTCPREPPPGRPTGAALPFPEADLRTPWNRNIGAQAPSLLTRWAGIPVWPDIGHSKSLPSSSRVRDRRLCPTEV